MLVIKNNKRNIVDNRLDTKKICKWKPLQQF